MSRSWTFVMCYLVSQTLPSGASPSLFRSFRYSGAQEGPRVVESHPPVLKHCTERFFEQRLDHFGRNASGETFPQRWFDCSNTDGWKPGDPVFLYFGNEADVELYLNNTGLMWEQAPVFGARIAFIEHRYFGKSLPKGSESEKTWDFLTVDQALADFRALITPLRRTVWKGSPIVGFGGSYGGMLCAWTRISAPWVCDACLAASAPIMSFMGLSPPANENSYAQAVTRDASAVGGSSDTCSQRIRGMWSEILEQGGSKEGMAGLKSSFRLCSEPTDIWDLMNWLSASFDYMAMGSYPYASSYILNGRGFLPPFPVRKACGYIAAAAPDRDSRFAAFREAVGIFYNASGASPSCFNISAVGNKETTEDGKKWNYLYCSGSFQVSGRNGVTDMYWNSPWNATASQETCKTNYGLWPEPEWVAQEYGGWNIAKSATRILFSNGALDPWGGGGVMRTLAPELPAVVIPEVGHHIDLFWSRPDDTPAVTAARAKEMQYIRKWIAQAKEEISKQSSDDAQVYVTV